MVGPRISTSGEEVDVLVPEYHYWYGSHLRQFDQCSELFPHLMKVTLKKVNRSNTRYRYLSGRTLSNTQSKH